MIPNQWYAILESNEIKKGKIIGVTRMGEKLVVWRNGKRELSVMSDKCPHRGVALSVGKLIGSCIQCPFHGFEYDSSGNCTLVPANGSNAEPPKALHVHTYPVRRNMVLCTSGGANRRANSRPCHGSSPSDLTWSTPRCGTTGHPITLVPSKTSSTWFTCPLSTTTPSGAVTRPWSTAPFLKKRAIGLAIT